MNAGNGAIAGRYSDCLAVIWCMLLLLASILVPGIAGAHEIRPAIADFRDAGGGRYEIVIQLNAEALLAGIGAEHDDTSQSPRAQVYDGLRALPPAGIEERFRAFSPGFLQALSLRFDGAEAQRELIGVQTLEEGDDALPRDTLVTLGGVLPGDAAIMEWAWPEAYGTSVIRIEPAEGRDVEGYSAYLRAGEASGAIALAEARPRGMGETFLSYLAIGFTHIVPSGLDHILFVVGLFLLSARLRPLFWQVTAFTLAHTVTLALGALGILEVPASVVEPLIAASIVYVAVENVFTDRLQRWRPAIVFAFGLLHGLGFAGVLTEIGLSASTFATGLIAFNIGVEFGQIAVLLGCYLAFGHWFRDREWYRSRVTIPLSLVIAGIAAFWFVERLGLV